MATRVSKLAMYLRRAKKIEVSPDWYLEILRASARFDQTRHSKRFRWYLVRNVPLDLFNPLTLADFYDIMDGADEEDVEQDVDRYKSIHRSIVTQEQPVWPVVVSEDGVVLDGYHRLAVLNDADRKAVDVLWARRRET